MLNGGNVGLGAVILASESRNERGGIQRSMGSCGRPATAAVVGDVWFTMQ